jgi:hypothetical protein
MLKANRKYLLLLLIFTFSFIYRMLLMLWDTYPSGADIGLHNSVIYSITGSGNVNFFYNFYHMGGGLSLTFPGYHLFASSIILMTGLPEYVAHAAVVSLFSALIVLATFLITRRVWSEPGAYIVTFLAAISRFDIEMLLWGGYPNVITLLLIPVIFYLYFQKDRFSIAPFLVSTSILAGSIFLTHSLSAAVYVAITVVTVLFALIRPKLFGTTRKTGLYWLVPIVLGAILFSPFLIQAVPAYLNSNSSLSSDPISSNAIKLATIASRVLPLDLVLPLFGVIVGFIVLSKKYVGRFLSLTTFLLSMWLFVPLLLTQSYLVGFSVDYNRFLYFLIFPLIIFVAVVIEHGSGFFAHIIVTYRSLTNQAQKTLKKSTNKKIARLSTALTHRNIYAGFALFFLLFSFLALPIFMGPVYNAGQTIQNFYQTMDNQGWEAIQWAKINTPKDSVFVSDALYGWWLGGFAQRRTYSAVDPQYLSINEEYNKTLFARNLLDTDYLIDNGYFQVREDGGYLSRHNPEFLAHIRNDYFPYPFFNFGNNAIVVSLLNEGKSERINLSSVPVTDMHLEGTANSESIVVTHGNGLFNFTQTTTVYTGSNSTEQAKLASCFATMTESIQTDNPDVTLVMLEFDLQTKGTNPPVKGEDNSYIGMIDMGMKTIGELIFSSPQSRPNQIVTPKDKNALDNNVFSPIELFYTLDSKKNVEFSYYIGVYQYTDDQLDSIQKGTSSFEELIGENTQIALAQFSNVPTPKDPGFYVFDYKQEMATWNVSYIAVRDFGQLPRFANDPAFSLVFINRFDRVINSGVAIFKVKGEP